MDQFIDWIKKNPAESCALFFVLVGSVTACVGAGIRCFKKLDRCSIVRAGFFSTPQNDANMVIENAYDEYIKMVQEQNSELEEMRNILIKSLTDGDVVINLQLKEIKSLVTSNDDESLAENHKPLVLNESLCELQKMFANYPNLPNKNNLTVTEIEQVRQQRNEYHVKLKEIFIAYVQERGFETQSLFSKYTRVNLMQ